MEPFNHAVRVTSLALLPVALMVVGSQTSASAANSRDASSPFSLTALRAHRLTDVSGFGARSANGRVLGEQGLAVMRAPSGAAAVVDSSLAGQGIASAAGSGFVDISWQGYDKKARYVVTRDGALVSAPAPGVTDFHDTAVVPGSVHRYVVAPVLPKSGDTAARMWSLNVTVPPAASDNAELTAMRRQAVSQAVAASVAKTTTLTWMDFIPQKRIDAPPAGCDYGKGYQFSGDNHTAFNWKSSAYRTALNAVITWSSKSVAGYKSVRESHVYKKSTGKLIATKTATSKYMSVKKLGSDSRSVDVRMVMHATNPFCKGLGGVKGAIDGAFTMDLTKSGNYSIRSGTYRRMPNNYIFIYDGGKVSNVLESKYANALCLVGSATCEESNLTAYVGSF